MADLILEIVEGDERGKQIPFDGSLLLGRDSRQASLRLDDDQVSRRHASVTLSGGTALVEDLDSTNGTYVNEQPIHAPHPLVSGDRIRVGLTVIQLRDHGQVARRPSAVGPRPDVTKIDADLLRPVPAEPDRERPPSEATGAPALKDTERPPAYVPPAALGDPQAASDFNALARLVDQRVKRRTNTAAFALLAGAGLAVLLFFGAR